MSLTRRIGSRPWTPERAGCPRSRPSSGLPDARRSRIGARRASQPRRLCTRHRRAVTSAAAAGPGPRDHLGDGGAPGTDSLNLVASALAATPGALYVGGEFTDAGGLPDADRIATWNGSAWNAVSSSTSQISNGGVLDIVVSGSRVFAGGSFQNAGGDVDADFLAVWDGTSWKPFCDAPGAAFNGNVTSLQIIGQTLYVGGSFQNGAGIASADYLLACDLASGAASSTVLDPARPFSGSVYALAADSNGTLYAGGGFTEPAGHRRRRQRRPPARRGHLAGHGRGRAGRAVARSRPSSAASPPSGPTRTSARTPMTSRASRRPTTSHAGTVRRGARWAPAAAAGTGGSRRPPRSTR